MDDQKDHGDVAQEEATRSLDDIIDFFLWENHFFITETMKYYLHPQYSTLIIDSSFLTTKAAHKNNRHKGQYK